MNKSLVLYFLILFSLIKTQANAQRLNFDKQEFYKTISKDKATDIDEQLTKLSVSSIPEKEAYEGVLLMKKSGLEKNAKDKLKLFKNGRGKLESSISRNSENIEYRFLRLIIQEHAPKIVKYHHQLDEDKQLIITKYKILPAYLQAIISDYSNSSKILKLP